MPSITLHPRPLAPPNNNTQSSNPLPGLLQTPSGLAIVEVQGTFNIPQSASNPESDIDSTLIPQAPHQTTIGRLVFPLHDPVLHGPDDTKWMKRVYLYIGKHQRMTGEVKKLLRPLAVVRKREQSSPSNTDDGNNGQQEHEELEVVEIVRYKVLFASRPEPVGVEEF